MNRTRSTRQPHKLTLNTTPPTVLKFWTAQAAQLAANGAEYERTGRMDKAAECWNLAALTAPANAFTKSYCQDHAKVAA